MPKPPYRIFEVADLFGCSKDAVRTMIRNEQVVAKKLGGLWFIARSSVDHILDAEKPTRPIEPTHVHNNGDGTEQWWDGKMWDNMSHPEPLLIAETA